jgi:hypothetical protein
MRWLLRPAILVVLSAALVLGATALALWPWGADSRPHPQPVPAGDQEVAWLYSATNAAAWERFVTAVQTAAGRADLKLTVETSRAFPPETTAVPELALSAQGARSRLLFRWYKLTSDWKTGEWVHVLSQRQPPPLAIIGGSSSDPAIELANCLAEQPDAGTGPLLLLTTATAIEGQRRDGSSVPLTAIYKQRTYRFCFTNQQMAEAVTDFLWSRDELRPDGDTYYLTPWEDDAYSLDLAARFIAAMDPRAGARSAARTWAWHAGVLATGGVPLGLGLVPAARPAALSALEPIYCGVGTFDQPNHWEAEVARDLLVDRLPHDLAQRSVLVLPAASAQPARRFLRALMRIAPTQARRFVVATGDAIAFNTVYRDRNVAWPIQDLPFDLVLFCHRNPVDPEAGFLAEGDPAAPRQPGDDRAPGATGTEDVLLYGDIVEALTQAAFQGSSLPADADALQKRLGRLRWSPDEGRVAFDTDGPLLFDERGDRRSGTGEHVVWLQPSIEGTRIQPQATISVWSASTRGSALGRWQPTKAPLRVDYEITSD